VSDDEIARQIDVCEAAKGTVDFAQAVEALRDMLPPEIRAEVEAVPSVYKEEEACVNRFINMVLITVEFVAVRTLDHEALYAAILARVKK
jgi:hypothetical protein